MKRYVYLSLSTLFTVVISVNISTAQPYCDESQGTTGFPSDPQCESAVCDIDPWCCSNNWDGICASNAAEMPECSGCLTTSNQSPVSGVIFIDYDCNGVLDNDDIAIEGVEIVTSMGALLTTSAAGGTFNTTLDPNTEYIITADVPGATSVSSFTINTPDTSNTYPGNEIAICPDPNYYDVSGVFFPDDENPSIDLLNGDEFTFFIHIFNHSLMPLDAELSYTFDATGLDVTEFNGGQPNGNVVTWQVNELAPLSSNTFAINLIVTEDAEIGNVYNVTAQAVLDSGLPADANPENDSQVVPINIGAPPPDPNGLCDQPQGGPGMPGFPECEAAVCADDAFCCSAQWDAICANIAADTPECAPCLFGAFYSTVTGSVFVDYNCNGVVDGDDFGISGHGITSSVGGNIASSDEDGSFSGYIQQSNAHHILPTSLAGFTLPDTVTIVTPDTSTTFTGIDLGMCPVVDYQDVASDIAINGSSGASLIPTEEFTLDVCVHNLGPWDSDGTLTLSYDDSLFVIVEAGGGIIDNGVITWNTTLQAMESVCFELEAVVSAGIEAGTSADISVDFELNTQLPDDQDPTNNNSDVWINIAPPVMWGNYCDQAQGGPGFPSDPACEAVICAQDPFCCNTSWDGICAASAANEPDCYYCLYSTNTTAVSGKVFLDQDCDGVMNNDDVVVANLPVFRDGQLMAQSNIIGEYSGLIELNQNVVLTLDSLAGFTYDSHTVFSEEVETITGLDFAVCPSGTVVNLAAIVSPVGLPPRPGFPVEYTTCVYNYSTDQTDAVLTFDISDMLDVQVLEADGGVVNGNEISWSLSNMEVFGVTCFDLTFQVIQGTPPGTMLNPEVLVEVSPDPASDIDLSNNAHSFSHEVVAAYDPNDKTVDKPVVNFTEIEEGEGTELQYVIRFQNTGNFFATNVRVEDQLPGLLDINTIETLHASHEYEMVIHPNNMVEWVFNDIMLPDSTANEPESHGQIHFSINTVPDIALEDVVENVASIFFDFKEPVITEPAITTFIDCSEGSLSVLGIEPVCPGEELTLTTNRPEFDILWTSEFSTISSPEFNFNAPGESVEVTVIATHPVCTLSTTIIVPVSEIPETEIVVEDNQLVATSGVSYSWYLDGELIDWATEQWIVPFENGTYTVEVEYDNGCIGTGELLFQSVGINDLVQEDILLVPNPAGEFTQLVLPEGNWLVSMTDVSGKLIFSKDKVTVNRFDIPVGHLAPGLYFVSVQSRENRMVRKLVVE